MRSNEFLIDSIEIISEKTNSDELMQMLEPLGFPMVKKTGITVKVLVPARDRFDIIQKIKDFLPNSQIASNGKAIKYDGSTVEVKPQERQSGALDKETAQIQALDNEIKQQMGNNPFIKLLVGSTPVNAAGAVKVLGSPKADTAIVDEQGNQVAWISLKDGSTPRDFGQWGGISRYANEQEVKDFVTKLKTVVGDTMPNNITYGMEVTSLDLKNKVVFGLDFDSGKFGINNVDLVLQGNPQVKEFKDGFIVDGAKSWSNGDIPSNEYDPVMTARYTSDRNDFGIKGARITIYPRAGRKWSDINPVYEKTLKKQDTDNKPVDATPQNIDKPDDTTDQVSRVANLAGVPKKPNVSTLQGTKLTSPGMTTLDQPQTESADSKQKS